jgi:hypothetical protein
MSPGWRVVAACAHRPTGWWITGAWGGVVGRSTGFVARGGGGARKEELRCRWVRSQRLYGLETAPSDIEAGAPHLHSPGSGSGVTNPRWGFCISRRARVGSAARGSGSRPPRRGPEVRLRLEEIRSEGIRPGPPGTSALGSSTRGTRLAGGARPALRVDGALRRGPVLWDGRRAGRGIRPRRGMLRRAGLRGVHCLLPGVSRLHPGLPCLHPLPCLQPGLPACCAAMRSVSAVRAVSTQRSAMRTIASVAACQAASC